MIVGTYFKINGTWYLIYAKQADELIAWIRSKTLFHFKIKETDTMLSQKPGRSVIRAALTRWTTHFLAYCRLYDLRLAILSVVTQDRQLPESERVVIFGDSAAKQKAMSMVVLIDNRMFWDAIDRYVISFVQFSPQSTQIPSVLTVN